MRPKRLVGTEEIGGDMDKAHYPYHPRVPKLNLCLQYPSKGSQRRLEDTPRRTEYNPRKSLHLPKWPQEAKCWKGLLSRTFNTKCMTDFESKDACFGPLRDSKRPTKASQQPPKHLWYNFNVDPQNTAFPNTEQFYTSHFDFKWSPCQPYISPKPTALGAKTNSA